MNLHAGRVALNRSVNATPAGVIPAVKYPLIHQAVLAACDAKDGVADGVLENPGACAFDPKVLQCSAHEDSTCLSAPQVESATKMYAGAKHPDTNALVLPGPAPGAELGWNVLGNTQPLSLAVDAFKYVFMKDRRGKHRGSTAASTSMWRSPRIRTMRSDRRTQTSDRSSRAVESC